MKSECATKLVWSPDNISIELKGMNEKQDQKKNMPSKQKWENKM